MLAALYESPVSECRLFVVFWYGRKRKGSLWSLFQRHFCKAPPSWLKYQSLPLLIPIPLRARMSTYEFPGDASIHTIALMYIYFAGYHYCYIRLSNGSPLGINLFLSFSFSLHPFRRPPHLRLSFIVSLSVTDLLLPLPHLSVSLYMTCVFSLFPLPPAEIWLSPALDATE